MNKNKPECDSCGECHSPNLTCPKVWLSDLKSNSTLAQNLDNDTALAVSREIWGHSPDNSLECFSTLANDFRPAGKSGVVLARPKPTSSILGRMGAWYFDE